MTVLLKNIEKILKEEEFDCLLLEESEDVPKGGVVLLLGEDKKGRSRSITITAQEQELGEMFQEKPSVFIALQFEFVFPFSIKSTAIHEMSSLFHFLNKISL